MKHISIERIRRSLVNLSDWSERSHAQGGLHIWPFLTAKRSGIDTAELRPLPEADDKAFWNLFMRVAGEPPYFDPVAGTRRVAGHPHSNASTIRKNRWQAWGLAEADAERQNWKFTANYVEVLKDHMKKANAFTRAPALDLAAWLYRSRALPDDMTVDELLQTFLDEFHVTDQERSDFFQDPGLDGGPEEDDAWFADRAVPAGLLSELIRDPTAFDLAAALAVVAEQAGVQPIALEDAIRLATEGRRQMILQGPPGTGKTHLALQLAAMVLGMSVAEAQDPAAVADFLQPLQYSENGLTASGTWDIVQFHPSYSYDDFVRGIDAEVGDDGNVVFRAVNKIASVLAGEATANPNVPVVLIVDELNRADVSKVLGELIFALEYRDRPVRTAYVVDDSPTISVPRNLFLFATMNTADRSIALIDYAIRRRFDFLDVGAARDVLEGYLDEWDNLGRQARVLELYDAVNGLLSDQPDFQVGPTYLMADSAQAVGDRFVFQILPLLHEYQREGLLAEAARVRPTSWTTEDGIAIRTTQPFVLAEQIAVWIEGA